MIIESISYALPKKIYSSEYIANICHSDSKFLSNKVGIKNRYFIDNNDDEIGLSCNAIKNLFNENKSINKDDIGLIIYVGQVKKTIIPHISSILQNKLQFNNNCACFDLGLACSGYIYALSIANSFMQFNNISSGIIITCDPYSTILDISDRNTAPLFGDAATATLIRAHGKGIEIGQSSFGTDGSGENYLYYKNDSDKNFLYMDGKGIFNFAMKTIPAHLNDFLKSNSIEKQKVDYFVFHQANSFMIEKLADCLDIPFQKCPIFLADVGNTVSSSIPLVLCNNFTKFKKSDTLVLCAFGAGLSWATMLAQFKG